MGLFERESCALVGMVHLGALPGSPGWQGDLQAVESAALRDAECLVAGGCDALIVENMGDLPYLRGEVLPETLASMTRMVREVVRLGLPTGVQLLAGANVQALSVAFAAEAHFLRVEAFAYGHVSDEGWMDACAGPLLRERAKLCSEIAVWADVQKKHASHATTSDLSLSELARGHAFCGADVLIATGRSTGQRTSLSDVESLLEAGLPVAVGSGVDELDVAKLSIKADALIVGSSIKHGGDWRRPVDPERLCRLVDALKG